MFNHFVILDDLTETCELMSPLGSQLLTPLLVEFRGHLHAALSERECVLRAYSSWRAHAHKVAEILESQQCFVLDKLLRLHGRQGAEVNVHRYHPWEHGRGQCPDPFAASPKVNAFSPRMAIDLQSVVLFDDVIFSGKTIETVTSHYRLTPRQIRVHCELAREDTLHRLTSRGFQVEARSTFFAHGDVLHARDFLCFLPFTGRRITEEGVAVQSLALSFFRQGACVSMPYWPRALRECCAEFPGKVVAALGNHLKRPAIVADIALLGSNIAVPVIAPRAQLALHDLLADVVECLCTREIVENTSNSREQCCSPDEDSLGELLK